MSLLDTFDPDSEEIVKAHLQRAFHPAERFPETVIMTFKEETFRILPEVCPAEPVDVLREGRTIPVYGLRWRERRWGSSTPWWAARGPSACWSSSGREARKTCWSTAPAAFWTGRLPRGA